jgi:hypothetical protein
LQSLYTPSDGGKMRRICLAGLAFIPILLPVEAMAGEAPAKLDSSALKEGWREVVLSTLSSENSLQLSVQYQRQAVGNVDAYLLLGGCIVSLRDISELVGFRIHVNAEEELAHGWTTDKDRIFILNLQEGRAVVDGRPVSLPAEGLITYRNDIYIDAALLSRLFPFQTHVNLLNESLTIFPLEPLLHLEHSIQKIQLMEQLEGQTPRKARRKLKALEERIAETMPAPIGPGESIPRLGEEKKREQDPYQTVFREESLAILQVQLGDRLFDDFVEAYRSNEDFWLPLGQLSQILDIHLEVDSRQGTAEGWIVKESNTLELDANEGVAVFRGEKTTLPAWSAMSGAADIYVTRKQISSWFPASFEIDPLELVLRMEPTEPFPIEQREKRHDLWEEYLKPVHHVVYEQVEAPYALYSPPFFDLNLGYTAENLSGNGPQDTESFSMMSVGDIGYMNASTYLNGSVQGLNGKDGIHCPEESPNCIANARFKAVKKSEDGMAGAASIRQVQLGDITAFPTFVTTSSLGRGLSITNRQDASNYQFDLTNFQGDAIPGWDVELYRNNALLGFSTVGAEGRYDFRDIPVLFGDNIFRLVLYGPQGQIEERITRMDIGSQMIEPGSLYYLLSLDEKSIPLLPIDEADPNHEGGFRSIAAVEYGLTRRLSAVAGFATTPLYDDLHRYALAGLRSSLGRNLSSIDIAYDASEEWAGKLTTLTSVRQVNLKAEQRLYSEHFTSGRGISNGKSASELSMFFVAPIAGANVNVGLKGGHHVFDQNYHRSTIEYALSTSLLGMNINNRLVATVSHPDNYNGYFTCTRKFEDWLLRGSANYSFLDTEVVDNVRASAQRNFAAANARLDFTQYLQESEAMLIFSLNLLRDRSKFGIQLQGTSVGEFEGRANAVFSLGSNPSGEWKFVKPTISNRGGVLARAFYDSNGNGELDKDDSQVDEPISFRIDRKSKASNERGELFYPSLAAYRPAILEVEAFTLPDPMLVVKPEGYSVLARPGQVISVDFLLVSTSEIDGTVFLEDGGVPYASIELLDSEGNTVAKTATEFDGWFLFENVAQGHYQIRVEQETLENMRAYQTNLQEVYISESDFIMGNDLFLERTDSIADEAKKSPSEE